MKKGHFWVLTTDMGEVLIVNFNSSLFLSIHREVNMFDSLSLDNDFLRALVVEHKVVPQLFSPQAQVKPSTPGNSPTLPSVGP
jgi:hypothetical protein